MFISISGISSVILRLAQLFFIAGAPSGRVDYLLRQDAVILRNTADAFSYGLRDKQIVFQWRLGLQYKECPFEHYCSYSTAKTNAVGTQKNHLIGSFENPQHRFKLMGQKIITF